MVEDFFERGFCRRMVGKARESGERFAHRAVPSHRRNRPTALDATDNANSRPAPREKPKKAEKRWYTDARVEGRRGSANGGRGDEADALQGTIQSRALFGGFAAPPCRVRFPSEPADLFGPKSTEGLDVSVQTL